MTPPHVTTSAMLIFAPIKGGSRVSKEPIIRYATLDDGRRQVFNEFIAEGVDIHFEAMGEAQWWMSVRHPDGRMWFINCGAVNDRARGYANCDLVARGDTPPDGAA